MGLFNRLLSLHGGHKPLEDFFTEIVVHLFATSQETLLAWLQHLQVVPPHIYSEIHISTQQIFDPLHDQFHGSRFDILIELFDDPYRDWIVIESKIGSSEGPNQLRRYAELLAAQESLRDRILIYITREFDPKKQEEILEGLPSVRFKQTRWHTFYNFLHKQPRTELIAEIIHFMEDHGMAQSNQFSAADILALSNLQKVYSLMNASLDDEVRVKLQAVTGGVVKFTNADHVRLHRRYYLWAWPAKDWWCGIGFSLPTEGIQEYPALALQLEIAAYARPEARQALTTAMQEISGSPQWSTYNLTLAKAWSGMYQSRSLKAILSEENHVTAIKTIFFELISELSNIRQQYPHLPWGQGQPAVIESSADEGSFPQDNYAT